MNYVINIEEQFSYEQHTFFRTNITDKLSNITRVVNLRYSDFSDLNTLLEKNNAYTNQQLPSFPQKDFLHNILNLITLEQPFKVQLNKYFEELMRTKVMQLSSILHEFISNSTDSLRSLELSKTCKAKTKNDVKKHFKVINIIERSNFTKTYCVSDGKKTVIEIHLIIQFQLKKFLLPPQEQSTNHARNYFQIHLKLPDTYIQKVHAIFEVKKNDETSSLFKKRKREPKKPYVYHYLGHKTDQTYKYLYALEEYLGTTLEQEIAKKSKNQKNFSLEQVIDLMKVILQGLQQIHKQNFTHRRIRPQNMYLTKDSYKIGGVLEPINYYQDQYSQINFDVVDGVMQVPEEEKSYRQLFGCSQSVDVYQFGVTLLRTCTFLSWEELYEIKKDDFREAIQRIKKNYGQSVSDTINLMIRRDPHDRAKVDVLVSKVFSSLMTPFLTKYYQKSEGSRYQKVDVSDKQLIGEDICMVQISPRNQEELCNFMNLDLKNIKQVCLNFKDLQITDEFLENLNEKLSRMERITLDICSNNSISKEGMQQFLDVLKMNQQIKRVKIYTDELYQFDTNFQVVTFQE